MDLYLRGIMLGFAIAAPSVRSVFSAFAERWRQAGSTDYYRVLARLLRMLSMVQSPRLD